MSTKTKTIQAVVLSLALLLPEGSAFANTRHHRKHYSQAGGALVGAGAGALIDHKHPLRGALIGAGVGEVVQYERNRRFKPHHHRRY